MRSESTLPARYLTQVQVAEIYAISERCLEKWRQQGRGPRYLKLGSLVRYKPSDIEAFIESRPVTPRAELATA